MEPLDEVDLAACVAGDGAAWDLFVHAAAPLVVAVIRRACRGRADEVEDLAQEVFVRLLRDDARLLRAFDPARARLSSYLVVIARSVAIEKLRRKRLPMAGGEVEGCADSIAAARDTVERDATEEVSRLPLDALSEQQRRVLELMHREGCSVPEVARRLGVAEQTVRSAHHKAVSRLRRLLGVDGESRNPASDPGPGDV
ncbi:MAG: sigma-70 family RNA polymerase sigma factor [Phycisphaeraceae bacterium]|nr:sigma-70 family RNA polymerase sigma factor [Phycisphaeraceae bacterium]